MKRLLTLAAFFLCSLLTFGQFTGTVTDEQGVKYAANDDETTCYVYGHEDSYSVTIVIPQTFQGRTVSAIKDYAFEGCFGLISITIPSTVTSIGWSAFGSYVGLASIVVEAGNAVYDSRDNCNAIIRTSDNQLIAGCKNTVIPNSVTSIGDGAFSGCAGLTSITIPSSVTNIGYGAFFRCSDLTSITIPNSVTSIERSTFEECNSLIYITIPNSVTSIEDYAFQGCGLTSIAIPYSVAYIGKSAFNCSYLTSVTVERTIPATISASVFSNRENATLCVPYGSIAEYANAYYWKEFKEIKEPFTGTVTDGQGVKYLADELLDNICYVSGHENGYNATIVIPQTFQGRTVTAIGGHAFEGCDGLTSITIPNSVTSIGDEAFYRCSSLTSITIPSSVTSIGWGAFEDCSGLTAITIPSSVTSIGNGAFKRCSRLTSIAIPNSVTSIEDEAFLDCYDLTSITIPSSVTSIGGQTFSRCSGLTSITIPSSVTSIGDRGFYGCSGLTSIVVEAGNTVYDSRENCNAIIRTSDNQLITSCKNTVIPNSVTSIGDWAFSGCDGLTSITIPNSVTSIGGNAFSGCSDLTSITIPNSVTSIGDWVFSGCSGLTSITIPNSVTSIGERAFHICRSLTSITIPNSVTSIGNWAFYGTAWFDNQSDGVVYAGKVAYKYKGIMPANTSIVLDDGTKGIGGSAFSGCSGLTSITIPNSVTSIGNWAFYGCMNLTSITIPNSVTSIGEYAFSVCSGLTSVTVQSKTPVVISESVFSNRANATLYVPSGSKTAYEAADYWKEFKEIKEPFTGTVTDEQGVKYTANDDETTCYVFGHEDNYSATIVIPQTFQGRTVSAIGGEAFRNCWSLTSITIPSSVTSIGNGAFEGCRGLTSITIPKSVTSIGDGAFEGCRGLTSITIPNSVTSIGDGAFSGCSGLTSITIPNSVTSIGEGAFYGCSSLTSITIPNSVTSIGECAFYGCSSLTSFTIPNSVTSIGEGAFEDCRGLISITIPKSVTSIGDGAFSGCSGLTSITIPSSVTSIGDWAFSGCSGLTSITIPNSVTSIGNNAFQSCSGLTSITIPSSVTSIGIWAFFYCTSLTSITIPCSVTSLGNSAFNGCSGLASIVVEAGNTVYDSRENCNAIIRTSDNQLITGCKNTVIPNSVTSIGEAAFQNCSGLTSITIPSSVTSIGGLAFIGCSGLTSITIPNSVTSIGNNAFQSCSGLTSITIPSSVTSIGEYAFYGCNSLTSVTVQSKTPVTIQSHVFSNRENVTLYVPYGSKAAYAAADYWKDFKEIVELPAPTPSSSLYAEETSLRTGSQAVIPVIFENEKAYGGLQCEVTLPAGITLSKVTKTDRLSDDFVLQKSKSGDNTYQILLYNTSRLSFTGNDGALFAMTVDVADNMAVGDYTMTISNIIVSDIDENQEAPADVSVPLHVEKYLVGDANRDNRVNVTDIMAVANYILKIASSNFNEKAADVNNDNRINVTDIMGIANIILKVNTTQNAPARKQVLDPQ